MIAAAEKFKQHDREFSEKHQAKQELEAYVATVEQTISSPDAGARMKRGAKSAVEGQLAAALEKLEVEDATADEYALSSYCSRSSFADSYPYFSGSSACTSVSAAPSRRLSPHDRVLAPNFELQCSILPQSFKLARSLWDSFAKGGIGSCL